MFDLVGSGRRFGRAARSLVRATRENGIVMVFTVTVRIDTPEELTAFSHGGILPYVLRQLVKTRLRRLSHR